MKRPVLALLSAIAVMSTVGLLGAASPVTTQMYLRVPQLSAAPAVQKLSYDAIATVPARPNTPASLLPADRVEGAILMPADATQPAIDLSSFKGVSGFTVVQTDGDGNVVQRTSFSGVSIRSIDMVPMHDGNMARRLSFAAASVVVTTPSR